MNRPSRDHFVEGMKYPLADDAQMTPPEPCEFSVGDLVTFTNDNGVRFPNRTVTGFAPTVMHGRFVYFDNSGWGFPVSPRNLSRQTHIEQDSAEESVAAGKRLDDVSVKTGEMKMPNSIEQAGGPGRSLTVSHEEFALIRAAVENYRELMSSPTSADRAANGDDWADREAKTCDALLLSGLNSAPSGGPDVVTLDLNVFDDVGNLVDGTTASLSVAQLSNIVDSASQLIAIRRDGQPLENMLDVLEEALSAADVIDSARPAQSHRG